MFRQLLLSKIILFNMTETTAKLIKIKDTFYILIKFICGNFSKKKTGFRSVWNVH